MKRLHPFPQAAQEGGETDEAQAGEERRPHPVGRKVKGQLQGLTAGRDLDANAGPPSRRRRLSAKEVKHVMLRIIRRHIAALGSVELRREKAKLASLLAHQEVLRRSLKADNVTLKFPGFAVGQGRMQE